MDYETIAYTTAFNFYNNFRYTVSLDEEVDYFCWWKAIQFTRHSNFKLELEMLQQGVAKYKRPKRNNLREERKLKFFLL